MLPQRTKKEYTEFCQALAAAYPKAQKIRLVQDNLNTHNVSSCYEYLPAEEAFALAQHFEFYYTPKAASWLNMIEIEFSALSRDCLTRRIPTRELLAKEVLVLDRFALACMAKTARCVSRCAREQGQGAGLTHCRYLPACPPSRSHLLTRRTRNCNPI